MPKPHRNSPERAHMLMMRRIEQNFRVGTPHPAPRVTIKASIPGGRRRRMEKAK